MIQDKVFFVYFINKYISFHKFVQLNYEVFIIFNVRVILKTYNSKERNY